MDETGIALGILGTACTLYGFSIAYYIFARSLQVHEENRIWDEFFNPHFNKSKTETEAGVRKVKLRRVGLSNFLLLASVAFVACVVASLLVVFPMPPDVLLGLEAVFFVALAVIVVGFVAGVAYRNRAETVEQLRSEGSSMGPGKGPGQ